eukprot:c17500_g1_i1.p1 GENE.c17500_g1_i1~~c17500_g1_i1.p1  ORF type:complete len:219 (+),score=48.34 c17500_g1_i1:67-723(+)
MLSSARRRFYTKTEVAMHNCAEDCWLSWLGAVYDLTALVGQYEGDPCAAPIIKEAGRDISHWFEARTAEPKTVMDPVLNFLVPYTPQGRYLHLPPDVPVSNWRNDFGLPWWKDQTRCIGALSAQTRFVRIVNTLTQQEDTLEVCVEETLREILDRYLAFNGHAESYTWKRLGRVLDMELTLDENGVELEDEALYDASLPTNLYFPALFLYFNDDLTEA